MRLELHRDMLKACFITFFSFLICSLSWARVDVSTTKRLYLPEMRDAEIVSQDFTQRVLPKSIEPNADGHAILSKMADNTVSYWWDTTPLRQTQLGQAAESIEKKARLQGVIQDSHHVTHTFDLKVLVVQALARFEYKGWIRAGINYDARASETEAEIRQPLTPGKDLVVSQKFNHTESTSRVSFQFDW